MGEAHAVLSASGASRWLACPPSALLEAAKADTAGVAAEEGTAAHALAEHKLRRALKQRSKRPTSQFQDDQMEDHTDDYVAFVLQQVEEAKETCADPVVLIEQKLDFSHLVPGGFGTGDCVIIAEPTLTVVDFKYGQGVEVSAENNPQMRLYALGALHAFETLYEVSEVRMVIYQPRRSNISETTMPVTELVAWGAEVVQPAAALAATGGGDFVAGAHCLFCKLSATCRARAEANLALAEAEFRLPPELSDAEIADVLARLPELTRWASDVQTYALSAAAGQGKVWPGFRLVAGRSTRKYADEQTVATAAAKAGFTDVWNRKLIGITEMERLLGKQTFREVLGPHVIKPPGKPALVPNTDKRPALHVADAAREFTPTKERKEKTS